MRSDNVKLIEKNLYRVIGVAENATPQTIKAAYRARAWQLHPDRYDQQQQSDQWVRANAQLAELNEAYAILRDAVSRRDYDKARARRGQARETGTVHGMGVDTAAPKARPFAQAAVKIDPGAYRSGTACYRDLPRGVRARLKERQTGSQVDQYRVQLVEAPLRSFPATALLCWYCCLFWAESRPWLWSWAGKAWYGALGISLALLCEPLVKRLADRIRFGLTSNLYLTPTYLIRTGTDRVHFVPLWALKGVSATDLYQNGTFQQTALIMDFDCGREILGFARRQDAAQFVEQLQQRQDRIKRAVDQQDVHYFEQHNDFLEVSPATDKMRPAAQRRGWQLLALLATSVLALFLMAIRHR